jgi:hypothetical protein
MTAAGHKALEDQCHLGGHDSVVPRQASGVRLDPKVPLVGVHAVGAGSYESTEGAVRQPRRDWTDSVSARLVYISRALALCVRISVSIQTTMRSTASE